MRCSTTPGTPGSALKAAASTVRPSPASVYPDSAAGGVRHQRRPERRIGHQPFQHLVDPAMDRSSPRSQPAADRQARHPPGGRPVARPGLQAQTETSGNCPMFHLRRTATIRRCASRSTWKSWTHRSASCGPMAARRGPSPAGSGCSRRCRRSSAPTSPKSSTASRHPIVRRIGRVRLRSRGPREIQCLGPRCLRRAARRGSPTRTSQSWCAGSRP